MGLLQGNEITPHAWIASNSRHQWQTNCTDVHGFGAPACWVGSGCVFVTFRYVGLSSKCPNSNLYRIYADKIIVTPLGFPVVA